MKEPTLEIRKITKSFGALMALKDIDMDIYQDEIVGLIGPNGAGKSTLFNVITGFLRPDCGTIVFKGEKIVGLKPHEICKKGIARTFQLTKCFNSVSVHDNVAIGAHCNAKTTSVAEKTAKMIELVSLSDKTNVVVENLTVAEKKKVEIARALATNPSLLLIDEPMAGLNTREIEGANELIRNINDNMRISIIIVEHIMKAIMEISDRIIVLDYGEKIAEGVPAEVCANKLVIEGYLGSGFLAKG